MDVTPSTDLSPRDTPHVCRCGQYPGGQQGHLQAPLGTTAEEPWVELPVRGAEGHGWSRGRMLWQRREQSLHRRRGGWGADAVRGQDRPRGGLAGAPALTPGGHAQADR